MSSILNMIRKNDERLAFTVSETPWPEPPRSAKRLRSIYYSESQAFRGARIRSFANDGQTFAVMAVSRNPKIDRWCVIK